MLEENNLISFYELLMTIKAHNNFPVVEYYRVGKCAVRYLPDFDAIDGSFICYELEDKHLEDDDIHYYLGENFLESDMFDKCLKIITKPKKIEKMIVLSDYQTTDMYAHKNKINEIIKKLNEIIDYINKEDK